MNNKNKHRMEKQFYICMVPFGVIMEYGLNVLNMMVLKVGI